jgi:curli production assembly/transport component CsgE
MSQIILGFTSLQDTTDTTKRGLMIELGGMLVDQTQSKLGREFYDIFYYRWESPEVEMPYTIFFTEKALPSFGTQISIVIN